MDIPLKSDFCNSFIRADSIFKNGGTKIASYSEDICGLYKNQLSKSKKSHVSNNGSTQRHFPFFNETLSNEVTLKFR